MSRLDHIKYRDNNRIDYILKMVLSTFHSTKWREIYGLNLIETMNMEFSQYMMMVDELEKHISKLSAMKSETPPS